MVRTLMACVAYTLFCIDASGHVKYDVLFPSDTRVVSVIACEEADFARTLYWEAVEGDEGDYYTSFLQEKIVSCQYVTIAIPARLYWMCKKIPIERCGTLPLLLDNGNSGYGVLLPTLSLE